MRFFLVLLTGMLVFAAIPLGGVAGTEMRAQVVSAGCETMSDGAYSMRCTTGQPLIGTLTGAIYSSHVGFWYPVAFQASEASDHVPTAPATFALDTGAPNPASGSTMFRYRVPMRAFLSIKLYDVRGREVERLADGWFDPGWHSIQVDSSSLAGGIYFFQMIAQGYAATRKLVLIK